MLGRFLSYLSLFLLCGGMLKAQAWKGEVNPDIPALEAKAKGGDPAAMAEFAFHSMRCMGGLKYQPKRIFDYFTRSAEAGNEEGKVGLAHCYCFNVGTTRNLKRAEELIREPLKRGHPVAQKIMGYFYYGKHGIKAMDFAKVREFNEMAAAQGCVAAQYNLAIGYTQDRPEKDVERGMNELRAMHEARIFPMASSYLLRCLKDNEIWEDHEEVARSCVRRISQYAEMDEPSALYRLGIFHQDAGDLENAVACYARSAQLGNGDSYLSLWSLVAFGASKDFGNVWSKNRDRGNLALRAYERGAWNRRSLSYAAWEITRVMSWNQDYVKRFPDFEKDSIAVLRNGNCNLHDPLGRLYCRAKAEKNPNFAKPEWGRAHLIFHSNHTGDAPAELSYDYFRAPKTTENLARGYASAQLAAKMGNPRCKSKAHQDAIKKQMTPEAMERAKELMAEGYPGGDKFRNKAEDLLIEIGHLPPREDR